MKYSLTATRKSVPSAGNSPLGPVLMGLGYGPNSGIPFPEVIRCCRGDSPPPPQLHTELTPGNSGCSQR
eukprot:200513-Prorocentrum_minimum.AAC.1